MNATNALRRGARSIAGAPSWDLASLSGRLVEISAQNSLASLTAAFGLVLDAQLHDEPAAWITSTRSAFFPPDAADGGVDLAALVVVRAPEMRAAAQSAAELLRSGAFGLAILDLVSYSAASIPLPSQTILSGLAQKHDAVVVFLTEKAGDAPSVGSLVSLRAGARRGAGTACEIEVIKDKRWGPGRRHVEVCRGPAGLR